MVAEFKIEDVMSASVSAHRLNKGFIKKDQIKYDAKYEGSISNAQLLYRHFFQSEKLDINETDIKLAYEIIDYLKELKAEVNLPFTNIPWGYGNLLNKGPFIKLTNNPFIAQFCENIFSSKNYIFNHLMVHNKAPWIGAGIEWHQEIFNIKTYAPGFTHDDWKKFAQIYIALEDQDTQGQQHHAGRLSVQMTKVCFLSSLAYLVFVIA